MAGAVVGAGRYRLLERHGGARGYQFWRAVDTTLQREVAITGVRDGPDADSVHAVLERAQRSAHLEAAGLARVLDVTRSGSAGAAIIVAEWTAGASLREILDTDRSPHGAARAVRALAAAAEAAHRVRCVLAIDHPDRIRISRDGAAVLAFTAAPAGADPGDDVRGLGAVLYTLLTGTWPLDEASNDARHPPETTVGGLPLAQRDRRGSPLAPHFVRPDVPYPVSLLAIRALEGGDGGVRTAATVVHVLDQAVSAAPGREVPVPDQPGQRSAASPGPVIRRRGALVAACAAAVVALALLGWWAVAAPGGGNDPATPSPTPGPTPSVAGVPGPAVPAPASPSVVPASPPDPPSVVPPQPSVVPPQPSVVVVPAVPAAPEEQQLPCDPGYHHDPARGGQCWA